MEFTDTKVKAYKDTANRPNYAVWDENLSGFGFRVQAGGSKVYVAKYRVGDKQRMFTIGRVDQLSLKVATEKAKAAFAMVSGPAPVDPAEEKAKARRAAGETFILAIKGFIAKQTRECSAQYAEGNRVFLEGFTGMRNKALPDITQADASRELKKFDDDGSPIARNRARSAGSAFFNWAWREGLCASNPFKMTNTNPEEGDGRERILKPGELKTIWRHLVPGDDYDDIVKLLMLTTCRRTEIGALRRDEINWTDRLIELPGKVKVDGKWKRRTKNGRPHTVPLTPTAFAILKAHCATGHNGGPPLDDDGDVFVFGKCIGKPFSGWSKAKSDLDALAKLPHWTLHDLRRTGDTTLGSLKVPPHEIDAVMNHVSSETSAKKGIRKKYNKYDFLDEKRAALKQLEAWVLAAVN